MTKSSTKSKSSIRVLLADDHPLVRAGFRQLFEGAGDVRIVAEASDGLEAQALIQDSDPDVAVLDIQMPNLSGIELTRWIRRHCPDVGVLILTAYDDDPYVMAVLQAGANGYVLKTSSPEDLIQAVRDVDEGKSALDPTITSKLMNSIRNKTETTSVERPTERELGVLQLAAKGFTNKAIGIQMGISDRTVQGHLAHIFAKMHASSRTDAVMKAVSLGWIQQAVDRVPEA